MRWKGFSVSDSSDTGSGNVVVELPFLVRNPITENEYDAKWKQFFATYGGDRSQDMTARRAMALAKFLYDTGWEQQRLVIKLGKTKVWVSYQLRFGRFLYTYHPQLTAVNTQLTERKFRGYWDKTDSEKTEAQRFNDAYALLIEDVRNPKPKPNRALLDRLMAQYADGKWHPIDGLCARLQISEALATAGFKALPRSTYRAKVEGKRVGLRWHYRIFRTDRAISLFEIKEKLGPIIEELEEQGRTNSATVCIPVMAINARLLRRFIDEWSV